MALRLTETEARAAGLEKLHGSPLALRKKAKAKRKRPTEKSIGEETFALHLKLDRIPKPEREYTFHPTRRFRFDFAWPKIKLAVEVDGGVHSNGRHNRGKGFEEDLINMNEAILHGWTVLRFSTSQVNQGMEIDVLKKFLLGLENKATEAV